MYEIGAVLLVGGQQLISLGVLPTVCGHRFDVVAVYIESKSVLWVPITTETIVVSDEPERFEVVGYGLQFTPRKRQPPKCHVRFICHVVQNETARFYQISLTSPSAVLLVAGPARFF